MRLYDIEKMKLELFDGSNDAFWGEVLDKTLEQIRDCNDKRGYSDKAKVFIDNTVWIKVLDYKTDIDIKIAKCDYSPEDVERIVDSIYKEYNESPESNKIKSIAFWGIYLLLIVLNLYDIIHIPNILLMLPIIIKIGLGLISLFLWVKCAK